MPEDFFWNCSDELAPFGSDEGDTGLHEYREWRDRYPKSPLLDCLKWTVEGVGEISFAEYNQSLTDKELIRQQIQDPEFDDGQYIFTLDVSVLSTVFGQLVDEGHIDVAAKPIAEITIERQRNWAEAQKDWTHGDQYLKNLSVLLRVLKNSDSK